MQYAIELFFDPAMEQAISLLSQSVAEAGLSTKYLEWKTRPHVTLACFNDVDEATCAAKLADFARTHSILPAYLGSVGMFTDTRTIFAAPIMTAPMYQIQQELHDALKDFDTTGYEWYLPNRWVPHCGIALTGEDPEEVFYRASDLVLRNFKKLSGKFTSVGLVKISFPVQEIVEYPLGE